MCGIVGYVGQRPCRDLLVAGLEKLEYRGYDSAGISLLSNGEIDTVRAVGNLANLRAAVGLDAAHPVTETGATGSAAAVAVAEPPATIGLGHTRWATHGRVTEENAHPHGDCSDSVHIVLNGIVENHAELRRELTAAGHVFSSETDAEIVAHLIEKHYDGNFPAAVRQAFSRSTRPLRVRRDARRASGDAGRGAAGVPVDRRPRRRRELRRLRDPGFPRGDATCARAQERRDRHRDARGRLDHRGRRDPRRARRRGGHVGRGGRREGRLPDLHDEGDPRAAGRRRRDDRRPSPGPRARRPLRARARRRPARSGCGGSSSSRAGPRTTRAS